MTDEATTLDADVVCVGGGGTGLAAAAEASEHEARVVVVEKRSVTGGNGRLGVGLFAADSPVNVRLRIDAPRDLFFRVAMEYAHWRIDPRIVRAWIDLSGDTIAWLEAKGVDFHAITHLGPPHRYPPTWHVPRGGGPAMTDAIRADAERRGTRFLLRTAVERLVVEDGRVAGVQAIRHDGGRVLVRAPRVIIGTGGFAGDPELLERFCPFYEPTMWRMGLPNDGSGIRMAWAAGAASDGAAMLQMEAPSCKGSLFINRALRDPSVLLLNASGERFLDEALLENPFESGNALIRQPGKLCFSIFDAATRSHILERQRLAGAGPAYEVRASDPSRFAEILELKPPSGCVVDDLAGVAAFTGVPLARLEQVVSEYNAACDRGYDALFATERRYLHPVRTPPFTVIRGVVGFLETLGGVRIDHHMRVLDEAGEPIPGLFAGGADTDGWQGDTYNFLMPGSSYSFAVNSGRIAGRSALAYSVHAAPARA